MDDIDTLIRQLWHGNWEARNEAPFRLGMLRTPRALAALCTALQAHEDQGVRSGCCGALIMMRDPQALQPLCAALGDAEDTVRAEAAKALEAFAHPAAVRPLCAALDDSFEAVRMRALMALGAIAQKAPVRNLREALPPLREMGQAGSSESELVKQLCLKVIRQIEGLPQGLPEAPPAPAPPAMEKGRAGCAFNLLALFAGSVGFVILLRVLLI